MAPAYATAQELFFWNKYLLSSDFSELPSPWTLVLIRGFIEVSQHQLNVNIVCLVWQSFLDWRLSQDFPFTYGLISRRGCHNSGTRFTRRGLDEEGRNINSSSYLSIFVNRLISTHWTISEHPIVHFHFWVQCIIFGFSIGIFCLPLVWRRVCCTEKSFSRNPMRTIILISEWVVVILHYFLIRITELCAGNAANFCEQEQVVIAQSRCVSIARSIVDVADASVSGDSGRISVASFVQTRGSIPLVWQQLACLKWAPVPSLYTNDDAKVARIFNEHIIQQTLLHDRQVRLRFD